MLSAALSTSVRSSFVGWDRTCWTLVSLDRGSTHWNNWASNGKTGDKEAFTGTCWDVREGRGGGQKKCIMEPMVLLQQITSIGKIRLLLFVWRVEGISAALPQSWHWAAWQKALQSQTTKQPWVACKYAMQVSQGGLWWVWHHPPRKHLRKKGEPRKSQIMLHLGGGGGGTLWFSHPRRATSWFRSHKAVLIPAMTGSMTGKYQAAVKSCSYTICTLPYMTWQSE